MACAILFARATAGRYAQKRRQAAFRSTECSLFQKSVSCQHYMDDALPVQHSGYYASGWPASELGLLQRVKVPITPMGAAHLLLYVYHNRKPKSRTFCELFLFFSGAPPAENGKSDETSRFFAASTKYWASRKRETQYPLFVCFAHCASVMRCLSA